MAAAPLTEANVASLELEAVMRYMEKLFDSEAPFWRWLSKASDVKVVSYRDIRVPMQIRPGGKYRSWDPEGGDLGRGGNDLYVHASTSPVSRLLALEWNWKAKFATNKKAKAIRDAVRKNISSAVSEYNRALDSELVGSDNGVLATVKSVSGTTLTLSDSVGSRRLRPGQDVQIYDASNSGVGLGDYRGLGTIEWVDADTKTAKLAAAVAGVTAGDVLIVEGAAAKSNAPTSIDAFNGVQHANDASQTGSYLGLDRSSYPELRGNKVDGGGAFTLASPRAALKKIGNRLGKGNTKGLVWWCHPDQRDAYEDIGMLVNVVNKDASGSQKLDLYYSEDGLKLQGRKLMTHYSWDNDRLDGLTKKCFHKIEIEKAKPIKVDSMGPIYTLYGASGGIKASNVWYMGGISQFYCSKPSGLCYVDNLT